MLDEYKKCIEACYLCAAAYDNCATSCLDEENLKMMRAKAVMPRPSVNVVVKAGTYVIQEKGHLG